MLFGSWIRLKTKKLEDLQRLSESDAIEAIQPNFKLGLLASYEIEDALRRSAFMRTHRIPNSTKPLDNPRISIGSLYRTGPNLPLPKENGLIVAVLDTGIDYTDEKFLPNLWRNPGESGLDSSGREKAENGIDDDENGFIDDVIGWDFSAHDSLPFDFSMTPSQLLLRGGNPGHGTYCAATVLGNGKNISKFAAEAPKIQIMVLRFLNEKGEGTTAAAIKAIKYAIDNGAKILSSSWGSKGVHNKIYQNQALQEVLKFAASKNVLFVTAAESGRLELGKNFEASNSLPDNTIYPEELSDLNGDADRDKAVAFAGFNIPWDGRSTASASMARAAAAYWTAYPNKTAQEVKDAILVTAVIAPALNIKNTSDEDSDLKVLLKK